MGVLVKEHRDNYFLTSRINNSSHTTSQSNDQSLPFRTNTLGLHNVYFNTNIESFTISANEINKNEKWINSKYLLFFRVNFQNDNKFIYFEQSFEKNPEFVIDLVTEEVLIKLTKLNNTQDFVSMNSLIEDHVDSIQAGEIKI